MTAGEGFTDIWVVQTKLQPPRLSNDIIARQPLLQRVHAAITTHHLTLISAPPGYGKTTLLAGVRHAYPDLPLTWLALDPADNDAASFLVALIAALQQIEPACGSTALSLLPHLSTPPAGLGRSMGAVINDVLRTIQHPFVLVLDDLHVITAPEIHAGLDYLFERLPPQMHVAVATRYTPPLALARLRARGRLAEFHFDDLRFSEHESAVLLNERLQLDLSSAQIRALHEHVEGWVTALQLLARSLRPAPAPEHAAQISRLLHSNRHIFDLLAEEVFAQQPPELRAFLLQTSILAELTPALCTAMTGRADAPALLDQIYRRNLFLTAVDSRETSHDIRYRYHDLFAHFLQQQVRREDPGLIEILHERAARADPNPARGLDHFLAAKCWDEAAQIIERIAEWSLSQGLLHRLGTWIEQLPPATRDRHPWLGYFLGVCAWGLGRFDEARHRLEAALAAFQLNGDQRGRGETMVQLAIVYQTSANFAPATLLQEQALQCPISPRSRAQLLMGFAYLALGASDLQSAQRHLATALDLAEGSDDPAPLQIVTMQLRSVFACLPNGVALIDRLQRILKERLTDHANPLHAAQACLQMLFHCWQGDLDAAIVDGERAWAISEQFGGLSWLMVDVGALLPRLYWLRGKSERADHLFTQFAYLGDEYPGWRAALWFTRGLASWDQGRYDDVRQCYRRMQAVEGSFEWPIGDVLRAITRGLLEIAERTYDQAERTLRQACVVQRQIGLSLGEDPRLLLAYVYLRQDRTPLALEELTPILESAERAGTAGQILLHGPTIVAPLLQLAITHERHGLFAASLLRMLTHAAVPKPQVVLETGETLTARELDVLRLLVQGASNQAIATTLVISLPTVKTHVSRILAKLAVQSRTEAAARARLLQLL